MIKVYGIRNCDSIKKTIKFLKENNREFTFIDYKKEKVTKVFLDKASKFLGHYPVNKRGTTFRKFKDEYDLGDTNFKIKLLINNSSMIKRPIVEKDDKIICVGFDIKLLETL